MAEWEFLSLALPVFSPICSNHHTTLALCPIAGLGLVVHHLCSGQDNAHMMTLNNGVAED